MPVVNLAAYFRTIKTKTGLDLDDFKSFAAKKGMITNGLLDPSVKASVVYTWLKDEFGLGRGHAMAIFHCLQTGTLP